MESSTENLPSPSWAALLRGMAWMVAVGLAVVVLAAVGHAVQAGHIDDADGALRATDASSARIYTVAEDGHAVRILNVRAGISEIGSIRLPGDARIEAIRLDASRRWLLIDTAAGRLSLDTARLALLSPATRLAEEGNSRPRAQRN